MVIGDTESTDESTDCYVAFRVDMKDIGTTEGLQGTVDRQIGRRGKGDIGVIDSKGGWERGSDGY